MSHFLVTQVLAQAEDLGRYPVCEASAAVEIKCHDGKEKCLLVGDNEVKTALFLYSVNSQKLDSANQQKLDFKDFEIDDIEAIAKLGDSRVLVFGSHSRNSQCEIRDKRLRFVQARVSDAGIKAIEKFVESPRIDSKRLFEGVDADKNKNIKAVSQAINEAEKAAIEAEENKDKDACTQANAFNAEGAVALTENPSNPQVWVGLRSPQVTLNSKNLAILMRMTNSNKYQFDGVALMDLDGRGIREMTLKGDEVWGIAGGPQDGADRFVLWKIKANLLKPEATLKPEIVSELPDSSEGLAIVGKTAYVLLDGDAKGSRENCKVRAKFVQLKLP